ncbi:MAG: phosphotransferase [Ectothiorhodospiraceae bacterium]|nr:phosphotransferase [Chromatiales bacterium]MCP5157581.1 phosphotransferase [Ectothiorhodospiraceae bacterium]
MQSRDLAAARWLSAQLGTDDLAMAPASEDASFRRYLRVRHRGRSWVLMDAPPAHEDSRPFVDVARRLAAAGVTVPTVVAADLDRGFLLLDDLGTTCYLDRLVDTTADALYRDALVALDRIQAGADGRGLPRYDQARLQAEMALFPDWLLARHLGLAIDDDARGVLERVFGRLTAACLEQPQVFVHRDYHSRNLMVLATGNPGILDFQDAVVGPVTYDLVSLLRDLYVAWPRPRVERWVADAHARLAGRDPSAAGDLATFRRWFDLTGVQRHLKVAGIFARLWHRDGKARYLADIPLTLEYLLAVARRHAELGELVALVDRLDLPRRVARANALAGVDRNPATACPPPL